jgi:DNA polymerase V
MSITRILHKYVPAKEIHVYSVDESFVDLSVTEKQWGVPVETIIEIKDEILETLKLRFTVEMDPNMLIAKLALD